MQSPQQAWSLTSVTISHQLSKFDSFSIKISRFIKNQVHYIDPQTGVNPQLFSIYSMYIYLLSLSSSNYSTTSSTTFPALISPR